MVCSKYRNLSHQYYKQSYFSKQCQCVIENTILVW